MPQNRVISLSNSARQGARHVLASQVPSVPAGKKQTWITLTRTGSFTDKRYGRFEITHDMLMSMVHNFEADTVGIKIFVDVWHEPQNGAAAEILKLAVEGNRLRALVDWTDYGIESVNTKRFIYLSAEFHENYIDNEQGLLHGPTLLGAGLTVRPVIKGLDPVVLSSESGNRIPIYIHPDMAIRLSTEETEIMNKHLEALKKSLETRKLSDSAINTVMALAHSALLGIEDETRQKALCAEFEKTAIALAEPPKPEVPPVPEPKTEQPKALATPVAPPANESVDDAVKRILAEHAATTKTQADNLAGNQKLLSDTIIAATGLSEEDKKALTEQSAELVRADMSPEQVTKLAQSQVAIVNQVIAARNLSSMGYPVAGTPHITVVDEGCKKLSSMYHDNLKLASGANLLLPDESKLPAFAQKILCEFDRINAPKIHNEVKILAGEMDTSVTELPYGVQRQVLVEALCDLKVLELITTLTDFTAQATTMIPYETRDASQIINQGLVYEGQEIPFAGVKQGMVQSQVNAMKIALTVTNELMHFSRVSLINWDAFARAIQSNARVIREMVVLRICNELLRASDAYNALPIVNEAVTPNAQFILKTVNFPVVRPKQDRDLLGNPVGTPENLLEIKDGGTPLLAYDGSGRQTAGVYYRLVSLNLGTFQLVNQLGVPTAAGGAVTISYSYTTNVAKFDIDLPTNVKIGDHYDGLLRLVGRQKAIMSTERFIVPDFQLMNPIVNDDITNATSFITSKKRDGTDTTFGGDLETIKNIPAYATNTPNVDLGEQRILMGQRGVGAYVVAKPFSQNGQVIEKISPNGHPTGEKIVYAEEYNSISVPKPMYNKFTSVLLYSATGRAAI